MSEGRPALVVLVKAPRAGTVKTRLCPPLSPEAAAELAVCFAQDVVAMARSLTERVVIAFAPEESRAVLEPLLPPGLCWVAQRGPDLGARLQAAAEEVWERGKGPLILLGTDSPTLPPSAVAAAIGQMERDEADVVLGPAEDGGYYLVGLRRPFPGLFADIAWSTSRVYRQTADRTAQRGLRLGAIETWYDVDTPEDMVRLRAHLAADPSLRARAPATARWLADWNPASSL